MKNEHGTFGMSRNSANQFAKIFFKKENLEFIYKQRMVLEKHLLDPKDTTSISKCTEDMVNTVRMYLHTNKIPKVWVQPVVNFISFGTIDAPLDNGISLEVDGQEITRDKIPKIDINPLVDEISDHRITISLSAKVNLSQIKKFLDDHKDVIELLSVVVGLPEVKPIPWKDTNLYLRMLQLKESIPKIKFNEIADKFQAELLVSDPNNTTTTFEGIKLKKTFSRFKKRFS